MSSTRVQGGTLNLSNSETTMHPSLASNLGLSIRIKQSLSSSLRPLISRPGDAPDPPAAV